MIKKSLVALVLFLVVAVSVSAVPKRKRPTPTPTPTTAAYGGVVPQIPGNVSPEKYDNGGEGIAYHDTDPTNNGGAVRSDGVDIEAASYGGYDIGWVNAGEWQNYTVNVTAEGPYRVTIRASAPSGGAFHVGFNGPSSGTWNAVTVPTTGGWQNWVGVATDVYLHAGEQQLTLMADTAGFNIGTITVEAPVAPASDPPPPPPPIDPDPTPDPTPTTGSVINVPAGADLQAVINAAQGGDTILLQPGATFTGNYTLPAKGNAADIIIQTAGLLPAKGTQVTAGMAASMAKIKSPNTWTALATDPYAQHYVVRYVEFLPNAQGYGDIITLGDGSNAQNSLAMVPHDLTLQQVYVHGDDTTGQKRGIGLNSASTKILDSRIENIWQSGADSQAIGGWNGPGPYTIDNNYLEAASENFLLGGADPAIYGLIPSDIVFTHNYVTKRLAWRYLTDRNVKNLFELKAGQRVHVEGNVFENNWLQAQSGYAIVLTGRSQDGNATWNVVQDFLFTNNVVRHVGSAINILGHDYYFQSGTSHNIEFRNNLFEDLSGAMWGGDGRFVLLNNGYDFRFVHNTILQDGSSVVYGSDNPVQQLVFRDNVSAPSGEYGIMGAGTGPGTSSINAWFPNSTLLQNVMAALSYPWLFPTGNFYPASVDDVGFVNLTGGNYRLSTTSIYKGAATDGKDIGADIDAINTAARTTY